MDITINDKQFSALKSIASAAKLDLNATKTDMRTIRALEKRELVKVSNTAKGCYAAPTAKGKKFLSKTK